MGNAPISQQGHNLRPHFLGSATPKQSYNLVPKTGFEPAEPAFSTQYVYRFHHLGYKFGPSDRIRTCISIHDTTPVTFVLVRSQRGYRRIVFLVGHDGNDPPYLQCQCSTLPLS